MCYVLTDNLSKVERHLGQAGEASEGGLTKVEAAAYRQEIKLAAWRAKVRGTCFAWCA